MTIYAVNVFVGMTETFEIEADSPEEAEAKYYEKHFIEWSNNSFEVLDEIINYVEEVKE
jgi:hypothetical protein